MTPWAAKVLAGVPSYDASTIMWSMDGNAVKPSTGRFATWIKYDDVLAAIAKLAEGDGLVERLQAAFAACRPMNGSNELDNAAAAISDAIAHIAALKAQNREMALDVLASSGQAQEAYAAQIAAEARISELVEECNQLEVMARDYAEEAAALTAERDAALASNRGLVRLNEATEARANRLQDALEEIAEYDTGATAGLAYTARAALTDGG